MGAAALCACLLAASPRAVATTVVPVTVAELTRRSEDVVVGTVRAANSRWHGGFIVTDCEVVVEAALKGASLPRATVFVRVAGGVVGGIGQHVPDAPTPLVGSTYVFFLQGGEGRVRYLTHLTAAVLAVSLDAGGRPVVEPAPGLVTDARGTPAARVAMEVLAGAARATGSR